MIPFTNEPAKAQCAACLTARHMPGFTLVEVLLVMLIVSILMGIVVLAIPGTLGSGGDLRRESERLHALLEMAADEAVLSGSEMGFGVKGQEYLFYRFDDVSAGWSVMGEEPFQARRIDEAVALDLIVEGRAAALGEEETPPVLLLSSGETTPFELRLGPRDGERSISIASDGFSGVTLDDGEK